MTQHNQHRSLLFAVALLCGGLVALVVLPRQLAPRHVRPAGLQVKGQGGKAFPLTVVDAQQQQVTLKARPARIVSLAPSVTEILFAIGAGDRLVADTTYCDYPAAAAKLPKIGGYLEPNVEKITALTPDLLIGARGTSGKALDQLRAVGLTLITIDPANLASVSDSIRLIGRVVDDGDAAERLAAQLDARRDAVTAKIKTLSAEKRPTTLFLFSLDGLFSAGPGSHIDEIIQLAGGKNVATGNAPWPQLSMEMVVAANPANILVLNTHGKQGALTTAKALAILRAKPQWRAVAAVKNGRVAVLDDDAMTLPGPRLVEGLEATAQALHPELFGQ